MDFTREEIAILANIMKDGGTILYPTETIWGIGCDATNEAAIEKINILKKRPEEKNYILLIDSELRLKEYLEYLPPKASNLIEYYTRPLTIIYDKPKNLPPSVLAKDGSIGIRVTSDPFCKALIAALGKPLVSTSANISGKPYPTSFLEIENSLKEGVDAIANYKRNVQSDAKPSAIVKVIDGEELIFLRK